MKKTVFIIFLFSTFNNIEAKNTTKNEVIFSSKVEDLPCTRMWKADMENLMIDYCATFEQALVIADRNFEECLDIMYGD